MQDARGAGIERRGMGAALQAAPRGLDADQLDLWIIDERHEDPDGIAAAADARHHGIWQPAVLFQALDTGFPTDYGLEVANHEWIGMGTDGGAE